MREDRWDKGGTVTTGNYIFCGKGKKNHPLGTQLFEHQRTVSSVKRVELVSVRVSYIGMRGRCSESACTKCGAK